MILSESYGTLEEERRGREKEETPTHSNQPSKSYCRNERKEPFGTIHRFSVIILPLCCFYHKISKLNITFRESGFLHEKYNFKYFLKCFYLVLIR